MTYFNPICADVGTRNCPCPLAETGDCLVCSRLDGRGECDCSWAGVCVYNEYIQNGSTIRTRREDRSAGILQRLQCGDDLLLLELGVPRGVALEASRPGSFLFLRAPGASEMTSVPVSVMTADAEHGSIRVALKIISAKTKAIAACEDTLEMRGVYHSGLLGKGLAKDMRTDCRWLILTRGAGFAPAVNLIRWAAGRVSVRMISDPENIGEDVIRKHVEPCRPEVENHAAAGRDRLQLEFQSLAKLLEDLQAASPGLPPLLHEIDYDRIFLLASDFYIKRLAAAMKIPPEKLVFCNNFHMCCGEGICGACGHTDAAGTVRRMCKCRDFSPQDLLLPV